MRLYLLQQLFIISIVMIMTSRINSFRITSRVIHNFSNINYGSRSSSSSHGSDTSKSYKSSKLNAKNDPSTDSTSEAATTSTKKEDPFLSTRIFVQNIPKEIEWPEFKDHFKKSGNVVYASISIDSVTKKSKGCGLIQYETADEATEAIRVMRDYPLRGANLFVRADVQEKRSTGKYTNAWKLGLRKTPRSSEERAQDANKNNLPKKAKPPRKDQPRKDGTVKNTAAVKLANIIDNNANTVEDI